MTQSERALNSGTSLAARTRRVIGRLRGMATQTMLITVAAATTLTAVAIMITPRYLDARSPGPTPVAAGSEANQAVIDGLGALIARSAEVLAVHPKSSADSAAILLRLEDLHATEEVLPEEIALLAHSRIMQTVTLYTLTTPSEPAGASSGGVPTRSRLEERDFCHKWRDNPDIQPRLIAAGISDMQIEVVPSGEQGRRLLHIALTWARESADGPDEASVLIDVVMRAADEQEN